MTGVLAVLVIVLVLAVVVVGGPVIEAILNDVAHERRKRRIAPRTPPAPVGTPPDAVGGVLIGATGESTCPLKPYGLIVVAGERHTAKSDHDYIESGKAVRVVGTEGDVLVVRESEEPPRPPAA